MERGEPPSDASFGRASDPAPSPRPVVWILEDSPTQGAMIADVLCPQFEVRLFQDSPALLETLSTVEPEVLVLDWQLPELSGLEVLRIVRRTHDEVTLPVLILTASGDDLLVALEAGANDFATKPFSGAELRARVSTLARVRLLHDRARRAEQQHAQALVREELARKKVEERAEFEQQLIGIVSHDLRTPISAIALGAALLAKDPGLSARQSNLVARLVSSAGRASRMVRDLLDFTAVRVGNGLRMQPAVMDFHQLTRNIVSEVAMANPERQIQVRQTGDAEGHWDADRLAQLVTNLVTNALHYSPESSAVMVESHGDASSVTLLVTNQGPPIPDEVLPRLFLPMQRGVEGLESRRRSVGLGLFIVDEIVRAHAGRVDVCSTVACTTFTVRLPRALASTSVPA
jgi:signal transduction histidine kinase